VWRVAKKKTTQLKQVCDSSTVKLPDDEAAAEFASLAWALAHPARVRIVRLLLGRTSCICGEIVDEMSLAQSTVSQHLKILKESGLIQGEIDGPRVCYCINRESLKKLKKLVTELK
jgi:ArsR family transcriptional regulator